MHVILLLPSSGLNCPERLWLGVHDYEIMTDIPSPIICRVISTSTSTDYDRFRYYTRDHNGNKSRYTYFLVKTDYNNLYNLISDHSDSDMAFLWPIMSYSDYPSDQWCIPSCDVVIAHLTAGSWPRWGQNYTVGWRRWPPQCIAVHRAGLLCHTERWWTCRSPRCPGRPGPLRWPCRTLLPPRPAMWPGRCWRGSPWSWTQRWEDKALWRKKGNKIDTRTREPNKG